MTGNSATLHTIVRSEGGGAVVFKRLAAVDIYTPCLAVCNSIVFTLVNGKTRSAVTNAKSMHTREQIQQRSAGGFSERHQISLSV
ncbi:MAG: hypothetical protein HKO86_02255 [Gammaproteobacteria bacterium]|nr:hypothetical protein [Gammaproteobacteria bacterium]